MSAARNWLQTLWHASYKGAPFWFESDDEEGGRGLVIHKFPHRDSPSIEDLGENPRFFSGLAYVVGDDADAQASALKAALASAGAGPLIVPLFGPFTVRCRTWHRRHHRDKLGYVAFEVHFVRDDAAPALVSFAALANVAFGAADDLAAAAAAAFAAQVLTDRHPNYVVAAASDGLATAAAALDALRTGRNVDPAVSAILRDTLTDLIDDAPDLTATNAGDLAASLIQATRDLAGAMLADAAGAAMAEIIDAFAPVLLPSPRSATSADAAANAAAADRLARLAALTAFAEALVRRDYGDRPSGVTARAMAEARFQIELEQCADAPDAALFLAIESSRDKTVDYLTRLVNDLAPIITVETAQPRPSLALAWRLYADPLRADELVARNLVRHPSFMPITLIALAS